MHGVRKVKTSEDKERERKAANKVKIDKYMGHLTIVKDKFKNKVYDEEGLKNSEEAIMIGVDCNLLWNYRKSAILAIGTLPPVEGSSDGAVWIDPEYVKKELSLTETCLRINPKCYWVWYQRKWIGLKYKEMNWMNEVLLCTKMLKYDARNFHCWNYRRFVVEQLPSEEKAKWDKSELDYTTSKIEENFSNYSSYHQRSLLLKKVYGSTNEEFENTLKNELEFIHPAFYISPDDQSPWFYYDWLISSLKGVASKEAFEETVAVEVELLRELLDDAPDCKWVMLAVVRLLIARADPADKEEIAKLLGKLSEVDPVHASYYKHLGVTA